MDCRNAVTFKEENIHILNEKFDAIVVGGGGLILPDSSPNMVSCWQWVISKRCIEMIRIPIYVISIGFNLFYGQTLDMPSRDNNHSISSRTGIFRDNIETLIEKAEHFSIRHTDDRRRLFEVIDHRYEDKVSMELCPTIWYTNKYWGSSQGKYLAVEIKDDRMWRRYSRIQKQKYYDELIKFITWYAQNRDANIAYMCHDGSRDFYNYMNSKGIRIPFLNNTVANENMIKMNYAQVHTLLCMAGHSEMIG